MVEAADPSLVACFDCGTRQEVPPPAPRTTVACITCANTLERTHGRSVSGALACSAATLILLVPGNLLTFLTTSALGISRHSVVGAVSLRRTRLAPLHLDL